MEDSILISVKKAVNVPPDDASFDIDLLMYINGAFSILNDIGVGPQAGFVIESDEEKWSDYLNPELVDPEQYKVMLSKVKMVVILRTRLIFDPPANSFLLTALQETLKENEWRLNVNREEDQWVDPTPTESDVLVIDGGDPSGE